MKPLALLMLTVLMLGCETETPVVEEPLSIIEAPSPVAASGQYLRVDMDKPAIVASTIRHGEVGVDPNLLHLGIRFDFDADLKLYKIDLRLDGGQSLGWHPRGVVDDEGIGNHIEIIPAADSQMLEFDTRYVIALYVQDLACWSSDIRIPFRTKPKP